MNHFSDAVVKNPIVGKKSKNSKLREWQLKTSKGYLALSSCGRCGSATYRVDRSNSRPPSPARRRSAVKRPTRPPDLAEEFDEVAAELGRTLDFFKVPKRERAEVLAAFAAYKEEVTAGYVAAA